MANRFFLHHNKKSILEPKLYEDEYSAKNISIDDNVISLCSKNSEFHVVFSQRTRCVKALTLMGFFNYKVIIVNKSTITSHYL